MRLLPNVLIRVTLTNLSDRTSDSDTPQSRNPDRATKSQEMGNSDGRIT